MIDPHQTSSMQAFHHFLSLHELHHQLNSRLPVMLYFFDSPRHSSRSAIPPTVKPCPITPLLSLEIRVAIPLTAPGQVRS